MVQLSDGPAGPLLCRQEEEMVAMIVESQLLHDDREQESGMDESGENERLYLSV